MNVGGAGRPGFAMAVRANLVRAPALVLKRWDASENTMTSESRLPHHFAATHNCGKIRSLLAIVRP
jgi:hypothetical protein